MLKIYVKLLSLLGLFFLFTYCSDNIVESTPSVGEQQDTVSVTPKFTEIQTNIFNQSCALSGCHVAGAQLPNLSGNAYSNLVNKRSSSGLFYIEPNKPEQSYLLKKVLGSSGISGARMPLSSSPLSAEKIAALTEWINNGAKND